MLYKINLAQSVFNNSSRDNFVNTVSIHQKFMNFKQVNDYVSGNRNIMFKNVCFLFRREPVYANNLSRLIYQQLKSLWLRRG